ncbi:RNA polymerase sigma-70 factor (ECF subfamily) [Pedobacter cryoconitis]|uniref:RNA polymerase sigma-70 factor (ECF subfamily) n=1 Tax=Pedobacter cryoconitis TaxID=188932 RepID=A0A7W8YSK4_9SPHI|nr:RNA polymerase sigma-70 factor [Pedobacter cryoconitis]MBB5621061.1 RNA polymerase sigma-70 factor (ECF subfamily) [Pedobacter cryoconitis]
MAIYTQLDDFALIELLKGDDESAFAEIYSRYAENMAGFACSKLYSLEDARDLIHDLFVKLWENRKQLAISSNLKTYLYLLVRHRIIDKIRKNITREEYADGLKYLRYAYHNSIEQKIYLKELEDTIEKSLNELSPRVKEIYQMSRVEELSIKEIAEKLGLAEQTVKNQLSTALKHLQKVLAQVSVTAFLYWIIS